jgi:WD40 repeat protein
VALSPDGKLLLAGSGDQTARLWDLGTREPLKHVFKHSDRVTAVAFAPDGKTILTAGGQTAQLWNVESGKPVGEPLEHADGILSAAWSNDGRLIATAGRDRMARLWDAATGKPLGLPLGHEDHVYSVVFGTEGKQLATASLDGKARLWPLPVIEGTPEQIVLWSQITTGMELTPAAQARLLTANEWQERIRKLAALRAEKK